MSEQKQEELGRILLCLTAWPWTLVFYHDNKLPERNNLQGKVSCLTHSSCGFSLCLLIGQCQDRTAWRQVVLMVTRGRDGGKIHLINLCLQPPTFSHLLKFLKPPSSPFIYGFVSRLQSHSQSTPEAPPVTTCTCLHVSLGDTLRIQRHCLLSLTQASQWLLLALRYWIYTSWGLSLVGCEVSQHPKSREAVPFSRSLSQRNLSVHLSIIYLLIAHLVTTYRLLIHIYINL